MKPITLLSVIGHAAVALASLDNGAAKNGHVAHVHKRDAVMPSSIVRLSVLSVLHTAIPSSALSALLADPTPFTNGNPPDWYKALPEDVKTLLPQLYPKAAEPTTTTTICSTSSTTSPSALSATGTPSPSSTDVSSSSSAYTGPEQSSAVPTLPATSTGYVTTETGSYTMNASSTSVSSITAPYGNLTTTAPSVGSSNTTTPTVPVQTTNGQSVLNTNILTAAAMAALSAGFCLLG